MDKKLSKLKQLKIRVNQISNISKDIPLAITPKVGYGIMTGEKLIKAVIVFHYRDFDNILKTFSKKYHYVKPTKETSYRNILRIIIENIKNYQVYLNENPLTIHDKNKYAYEALVNLKYLMYNILNDYLHYKYHNDKIDLTLIDINELENDNKLNLVNTCEDEVFENTSAEYLLNSSIDGLSQIEHKLTKKNKIDNIPFIYAEAMMAIVNLTMIPYVNYLSEKTAQDDKIALSFK